MPDLNPEKAPPLPLSAADLAPSKSKDELEVAYDEAWSEMRSGRAGRQIYCYVVKNLTKGSAYSVELFEDANGVPHSFCNCPSRVVDKHQKAALLNLLQHVPTFGAGTFSPKGIDDDQTATN